MPFGTANPDDSIILLMLPPGVVLVDDFSPGSTPSGAEAEQAQHPRRRIKIDDEAADSKHGLGGFHGSIHPKTGPSTVYYAVAVFSEGDNGIPFFLESWKNVVATHYHELNEARTDPDIEDIIRGGPDSLAGWYSPKQGEIGDIPINVAPSLNMVMKEVKLTDGSDTVPVQLMWSNKVGGLLTLESPSEQMPARLIPAGDSGNGALDRRPGDGPLPTPHSARNSGRGMAIDQAFHGRRARHDSNELPGLPRLRGGHAETHRPLSPVMVADLGATKGQHVKPNPKQPTEQRRRINRCWSSTRIALVCLIADHARAPSSIVAKAPVIVG